MTNTKTVYSEKGFNLEKKVTYSFYSAKGYQLDFVRFFAVDDFFYKMLDELNVLTTFVNTKDDFDKDTISKITIEY